MFEEGFDWADAAITGGIVAGVTAFGAGCYYWGRSNGYGLGYEVGKADQKAEDAKLIANYLKKVAATDDSKAAA